MEQLKRRTFLQGLAAAGVASPLSQYLAIAKPISPAEGTLIDFPLYEGDQILMLFPDDAVADWFLLLLKPSGQRIKLYPNAELKKFWVYTEPIFRGATTDAKGDKWATYDAGDLILAFKYKDYLIRSRRTGTAQPVRFRIEYIDPWEHCKGKDPREIDKDRTLLATSSDKIIIPWNDRKNLL
jgi:hypothetical protein